MNAAKSGEWNPLIVSWMRWTRSPRNERRLRRRMEPPMTDTLALSAHTRNERRTKRRMRLDRLPKELQEHKHPQ